MAVRVIREEFNTEYRGIVIDDRQLYEEVREYASISARRPRRALRRGGRAAPHVRALFHVHEQLHKALDRKVWLPSEGPLIVEHTERHGHRRQHGQERGTSSLEETVSDNLEAAVEVARQLRLRDIGGIVVIDFIDMEVRATRPGHQVSATRWPVTDPARRCRHLRPRPGRDDAQAHRRGPARVVHVHLPVCEGRERRVRRGDHPKD